MDRAQPQRLYLPRLQAGPDTVGQFEHLARLDVHGVHSVTRHSQDADLILFTEAHMFPHDVGLRAMRRHDLYRRRWSDCFIYDERDRPWPSLPGLYVSQPRSTFAGGWQRAVGYHTVPDRPSSGDPDLLFSFVGSATHPLRERLFRLKHDRAHIERVTGFVFYDPASDDFMRRKRDYDALLSRTKFVLCPRGKGTSSIRQYEVLAAGRVPVIVSDDWVQPDGPDWSTFSVRCPEDRIADLPKRLEELEPAFLAMSSAAREAYERFYAPNVVFHHMVEKLIELRTAGAHDDRPALRRRSQALASSHADHASWCGRNKLAAVKRFLLR